MKVDGQDILDVLENLPASGETKYPAMTYEQGIEEALLWVLGDITDEEFEYSSEKEQ